MITRTFFMCLFLVSCSSRSNIVKVKVTNLNNEAVVGVLGPTLGKFGGGNISGKDGYVSVPSTLSLIHI